MIVLGELSHAEHAAEAAKKIIDFLSRPQRYDGREFRVTACIGISVFPEDGENAETLLKNADLALYEAKEDEAVGGYKFFRPDLNIRAVERLAIETALHNALDRGEFFLVYQPKIDLRTGRVTGAEALIRWCHPERGLIAPPQFIAVAEDCGLIIPIGRWVVQEACAQARAWQEAGLVPIVVSVNICAIEFRSDSFLANLVAVLSDTGLEPRYLQLELTESVLMAHVEATDAVLRAIKGIGVGLAIDDFGTGWSSLSYLRRFPIDTLKVDQSFVQEITASSDDAPIVRAVVSMGRSLKHRVVAEGVETREQLAFLQALDCDEGQGYYFSRPVMPAEFSRLLAPGASYPWSN